VAKQDTILAGCSKRPSSKAAASEDPEAYPLGYVEDLNDARTTLADFFSILLLRKCEFRQLSLLEPLLDQRADIEQAFDLLNVVESGFRAGVWRGEE
jgi:hypothetical protein